jgi:hypothetical protein
VTEEEFARKVYPIARTVARELGVAASRISQIRTGALGRIRDAQRTPDAPSPTG